MGHVKRADGRLGTDTVMWPMPAAVIARTFITTRRMTCGELLKYRAQLMAGHGSLRTTKLYDRTGDEIMLFGGSARESVFPFVAENHNEIVAGRSAIRFKVRMVACVRPRSNLVTLA
jgi:hypothetical protein